jgi:hypothetical protein
MKIDGSDEQSAKTESPILVSFDPGSNVTLVSAVQPWKQHSSSVSMDDGRQRCESDEHSTNEHRGMAESRQPASKITSEMLSLPERQPSLKLGRDAGIRTSDELPT